MRGCSIRLVALLALGLGRGAVTDAVPPCDGVTGERGGAAEEVGEFGGAAEEVASLSRRRRTQTTGAPTTALMEEPDKMVASEKGTAAPAVTATQATIPASEHYGMLTLQAHLSDQSRGIHNMPYYIILTLRQYQLVVEMSLATHFGLTSVRLLGMEKAGRRLADAGSSINIRFVGQGSGALPPFSGLKVALQEALSEANAGLTIKEAAVEWATSQVQPTTATSSDIPVGPVVPVAAIVGIGLFVCGFFVAVAALMKLKARIGKGNVENGQAAADGLGKTVDAYITPLPETEKKSSDENMTEQKRDAASEGSTGSPVSDLADIELDDADGHEDMDDEVPHGIEQV